MDDSIERIIHADSEYEMARALSDALLDANLVFRQASRMAGPTDRQVGDYVGRVRVISAAMQTWSDLRLGIMPEREQFCYGEPVEVLGDGAGIGRAEFRRELTGGEFSQIASSGGCLLTVATARLQKVQS